MTFVKAWLPAVLMFCAVGAHATCDTQSVVYVFDVLGHSIALNEEFKHSVNSDDEERYRSLRKQVEQYTEETTMPCARRAQRLLARNPDQKLMFRLMEFAVSYENSADETVSTVMASVFIAHPRVVENELNRFPLPERDILLRSIEVGWANVSNKVPAAQRRDREARLRSLLRSEPINPVKPK